MSDDRTPEHRPSILGRHALFPNFDTGRGNPVRVIAENVGAASLVTIQFVGGRRQDVHPSWLSLSQEEPRP